MNRREWLRLPGFLLLVGLTSCGGSGGGAGGNYDRTTLLPYTGLSTPALLDPSNVVQMTEMATYGAAEVTDYSPDITEASLSAARVHNLALTARSSLEGIAQAARSESWSEDGNCGGTMDIAIDANERTGTFSATIVAKDYCDDGVTIDGDMEISGRYDNIFLSSMTIHFELVTIIDAEDNVTIAGTVTEDFTGPTPATTLSINYRENASAKIYRFVDYIISTAYRDQNYTESITGRLYHPDYGYVDVSTVIPFSIAPDGSPASGEAVCSGVSAKKSKLTALSTAAYRVSADFDGDGEFDDFSSLLHYPGKNTLPVVSAGNDFIGNVGCGELTVSTATATDADTDPLTLSWILAAKPDGSRVILNDADTLTPSFTPDLAGEYILRLSASDGIGTSVEASATVTVYGDLFCLNAKTFIPAALLSKPEAVALGDVTGDGREDVVFLTSSTGRVDSDPNQDYHLSVFAQTMQGTLASPQTYPAGDGFSLTIADLNNDGRNDVAVSSRTGVALFYQTLQGTFDAMQLLPFDETIDQYEPHSVVAADFTGDGRIDLASVYSNFTTANIRLYAQSETGVLGTPTLFTTDPGYWIARAADVNGDLKTDLVLTSHQLGRGSVYLGAFAKLFIQSDGGLSSPTPYLTDNSLSPSSFCAASFALTDLNSDNRPDLLASCQELAIQPVPFLRLYPQQGDGTLGTPVNFAVPASYWQLEAVDFDGDNREDLIGLSSWNQSVFDLFRNKDGGLVAAESYPAGTPNYNDSTQAFAIGDINSDGYPDIVTSVDVTGDGGGNGVLIIPGNPHRQ